MRASFVLRQYPQLLQVKTSSCHLVLQRESIQFSFLNPVKRELGVIRFFSYKKRGVQYRNKEGSNLRPARPSYFLFVYIVRQDPINQKINQLIIKLLLVSTQCSPAHLSVAKLLYFMLGLTCDNRLSHILSKRFEFLINFQQCVYFFNLKWKQKSKLKFKIKSKLNWD